MDYLTHLRLGFQFLLSPIFLMGVLLSGGRVDGRFWEAYLAFHLFLYAGGTAYNSVYDRDEGPVGGLAKPPPPPRHLLLFSLVWQAAGFLLALAVNGTLALIYFIMFWMSVAYSHPHTRWKGHPLGALVTIALGQGVLPFLAGWAVARGELAGLSWIGLLGLGATTCITVGLYPLTSIYQVEEDARRGDMTAARWLGARGSFFFAGAWIALGAVCGMLLIASEFTAWELLAFATFLTGLLLYLARWARRFSEADILGNFRRIMALYAVSTGGFILWLGARLALATLK